MFAPPGRGPTWMVVALLAVLATAAGSSRPHAPVLHQPRPAGGAATTGFADIGGVQLYYQTVGDGPPLVLLHGGLSSSVDFKAIIPLLSPSRRLILVDRRGHGRSFDNAEPYSYAALADDMKAFLDYLHVDGADVLGFSDGGVIGYHLASRHPRKVRRLVAVGANYRVEGMTPETIEWARHKLTPGNAETELPEIAAAYRASSPQPENFANFVAKSQALWLRDPYISTEALKQIQAPVLLVAGEQDAVRLEHVLEIRALLKDGHLCVLPGATHFVLFQKPALVWPIVADFFAADR